MGSRILKRLALEFRHLVMIFMKKFTEHPSIKGKLRVITTRAGKIVRMSEWTHNLVVSSANYGRNIIAQRLAGTNTYTLNITHGEIGTGSTAPTNNDTALQTPSNRIATTLASVSNNVVTLQFFFSDATLPNNTYREFGVFIDGTATLGTGQLFARAVFATSYTKATGEDTTIEYIFTLT